VNGFENLTIRDAQRELRHIYRGGLAGQLVSGALWLVSAALATWGSFTQAVLVLVLGGVFIFPLTMLVLRLAGRRASLPAGHPFAFLAMQTAFIVPLLLPVVLVLTRYDHAWFFPAILVVVGAHYLPFATLYGMGEFLVLGGAMLAGGVLLGLRGAPLAAGGWLGAVLLLAFAPFGWRVAVNEERREARKE
jgi:cytochrome b subunit of formate dehydrogenase